MAGCVGRWWSVLRQALPLQLAQLKPHLDHSTAVYSSMNAKSLEERLQVLHQLLPNLAVLKVS